MTDNEHVAILERLKRLELIVDYIAFFAVSNSSCGSRPIMMVTDAREVLQQIRKDLSE